MSGKVLLLVCIASKFKDILSKNMEPFVVGGKPASMAYFGHSAFLSVDTGGESFICGSSIINQHVILSAAHCFEDFDRSSKIAVRVGSANKLRGSVRYASRLAVHTGYDPDNIRNDIALAYMKNPLILGANIKRVVLMRRPPETKLAFVAGWGLVDEGREIGTNWLQQTEQQVWRRDECRKTLKWIPPGCLCGGAKYAGNYASEGDSGSALVTNGGIQIGLVSFKRPDISRSVVVYTDVPYYYDWITTTTKRLHCN